MDQLLDVSDLPAPQPQEGTLDALAMLPAGDRLLLLRHRRQPFPLYDMLRRMGYHMQVDGSDGAWHILIEPAVASSSDAIDSGAQGSAS
ncbi:MAG: DUF2249 domain-containing protein [Gammaproteobacteria bacterium]|jgi:hypothetical protein|nr:DUF2249 domain-containing protein [Gammaproteobacteria bacterium]